MSTVIANRFTTRTDDPFVVFLIGMRINKLGALRKSIKVAKAFVDMISVLNAHPEKGFLHGEQFYQAIPFTTIMVSYWRTFDDLERFARDEADPHLAAWRSFNKQIGTDGSIGVYHETYTIQPGSYESFYTNMPLFGLAGATGQAIPAASHKAQSARGRLNQHDQSDVNVEQQPEVNYEAVTRL